jgi:hypothetical protein
MRAMKTTRTARRLLVMALPLLLLMSAPSTGAQWSGFNALILSPEPGEVIPQTLGLVAVSFIDPDRVLDLTSVHFFLDNNDRTAEVELNADVLVWRPQAPLRRGVHTVGVTMKDASGAALPTLTWSFITGPPPEGVSPTEMPAAPAAEAGGGMPAFMRLRGDVRVEAQSLSLGGDGAEFRREAPAATKAWVNLNGRLGGSWRWTGHTHVSSYESHTIQPVNRFRFDVRSNWLTLSVGDVSTNVQELILWGRRVRGWAVDLRAGVANLTVVSGQSRRAVDGQLFSDDPTRVFRRGAYAQDLLAIRPYFGNGDPWTFGITLLKVRDAVDSIDPLRTFSATSEAGFASVSANPQPKDNLVLGIDLTWNALDGRLNVSYNNALSLYANDISGGPLTKAELDSVFEANDTEPIDFDPADYESIFILNSSLIPLDLTGLTNVAQQVRGNLTLAGHTLGVRWRSVGGSFYTLGQPSLQRDRSGLRIQDTFRILQNALGVTVGWEKYSDNLDETKPVTTATSALTLDVFWQPDPARPGFSLGYRTFGRNNDLLASADGGMDENTSTYSGGAFIPVRLFGGMRSRININYANVGREDALNSLTGTKNTYYLIGLSNRFDDRPTEFTVTYGLNTAELTGYDAQTTFNRLLFKGRHGFTSKVFGIADLTYTGASSPESAGALGFAYNRLSAVGGAEYRWSQSWWASLEAGFGSYTDDRRSGLDTTEMLLRLRLNRTF